MHELYQYSDDPRDSSNCVNYQECLDHYEFVVEQVARLTKPGRLSCVHCTDLKRGILYQYDFPGDIIRLHEKYGMHYFCRTVIWKDPWEFARRTRMKTLMHMTIVKDSATSRIAPADHLVVFLKPGENQVPITHTQGFKSWPGSRRLPRELMEYLDWKGDQRENRLSHQIYRWLASPVWMDIRRGRMLPYEMPTEGEEAEERHVCVLQRDFIERCLMLWSNPGEIILDPFGGVGSTPFCSVRLGRRAIATELKPTYFRQMVENMKAVDAPDDEGFRFEMTDDDGDKEDDGPVQATMFGNETPDPEPCIDVEPEPELAFDLDSGDTSFQSVLDRDVAEFVKATAIDPLPAQASFAFTPPAPKPRKRKAKR